MNKKIYPIFIVQRSLLLNNTSFDNDKYLLPFDDTSIVTVTLGP